MSEGRPGELREPVLILTGAGISAESGVPTFRGAGGLWNGRRPEDLATPEAFRRDPALVWEWYQSRRRMVRTCAPNAAHLSIARFALTRPGGVTLVTQNVDGLHAAAARAASNGASPAAALPLELHGSLFRDRCTRCGWRSDAREEPAAGEGLPACVACGALARPDVIWFGEALDGDLLDRAVSAAAGAATCLVVGTSALVHPAASLPEITLAAGGRVIEVNPEPTPFTPRAAVSLRERAVAAVPRLLGG